MAYIAFIAILFGAAGVVGGIEAGNTVGTIDAAVIHISGIIAMAVSRRKEKAEEGTDLRGGATVDKPYGERCEVKR